MTAELRNYDQELFWFQRRLTLAAVLGWRGGLRALVGRLAIERDAIKLAVFTHKWANSRFCRFGVSACCGSSGFQLRYQLSAHAIPRESGHLNRLSRNCERGDATPTCSTAPWERNEWSTGAAEAKS